MLIGSQLSFRRDDPSRQRVHVLLWQFRHEDRGIEWLVEPVAGARRVYIRHIEMRAPHRPCRIPGQRWTRCVVTIDRAKAEALGLMIYSAAALAAIGI